MCDSDIIMADLLEPQYFINMIYITKPFKQTYAIKEIKNVLAERFSLGGSDYSKIRSLPDDLSYGGNFGSTYQYRARFTYNPEPSGAKPSLRPQTTN